MSILQFPTIQTSHLHEIALILIIRPGSKKGEGGDFSPSVFFKVLSILAKLKIDLNAIIITIK